MAKDTKERILMAALDMFSKKGYEGTNIRELAASLELVKSGIYKHYESKEAIWNALLDRMIAYYGERFGSAEHLPPVPDSLEDFVSMTMRMVNITIHDEQIVKTRKVLTLEQYRDERARDLATKHFLTGLTEMFTRIFSGMMEKGLIRRDDPEMLAFAYATPISALIHLCDREPEKTEDAIRKIEAFSRHFIATYYTDKGCEVKNLAIYMGMNYQYKRLDSNNFTRNSLDDFVRHQTVTECWRKINDDWRLVPNVFEENWSPEQCREIAEDVVQHISLDQTGFGAFDGGRIIGFATVSHRIFGAAARYAQLVCFQISEEYRRQGVGRKLFSLACEEARRLGAEKLYISAHSSKESQAAYRALGCTPAEEVNEGLAAAEPFDVQMEYRL